MAGHPVPVKRNRTLWQHAHGAALLGATLLFTAGFLCVLLWTNDIVHTPSSSSGAQVSTFTYMSPIVSTFDITYNVALFGAIWNSILFIALAILQGYTVPLPSDRLRWEFEKAATIISVVGNTIYSIACLALMATLARLAADATTAPEGLDPTVAARVASSSTARRAGQGATAAMAGVAAATAIFAAVMDVLHGRRSVHRQVANDIVNDGPLRTGDNGIKEA